jgi:type IV secretory pathway component VirB8
MNQMNPSGLEMPSDRQEQIGQYPADVHVPPLEGRRHLWTSRAFAIGLYVSMILNVILAIGLTSAWNLREVVPMMVSFDEKKDTFVRIRPIDKSMPGLQFMTEKLLGEYVKMREEVVLNESEMKDRYTNYILNRTSTEEYKRFFKQKTGTFNSFLENEITRKVNVEVVDLTPKGYYTVDYETEDYDLAQQLIAKRKWRAFVTMNYLPRQVPYDDRYVNPLGFQVQNFSVKQRD